MSGDLMFRSDSHDFTVLTEIPASFASEERFST